MGSPNFLEQSARVLRSMGWRGSRDRSGVLSKAFTLQYVDKRFGYFSMYFFVEGDGFARCYMDGVFVDAEVEGVHSDEELKGIYRGMFLRMMHDWEEIRRLEAEEAR